MHLTVLSVLLVTAQFCFARIPITLSAGAIAGSTCETKWNAVLSGARMTLFVRAQDVSDISDLRSRIDLEIGKITEVNTLTASPHELDSFFVPVHYAESVVHAYSCVPQRTEQRDDYLRTRYFNLVIPSELSDEEFCIRGVIYDENGNVLSYSYVQCFSVVAPCSRTDTATILSSMIDAFWWEGKRDSAICFANKMMTDSLCSIFGVNRAIAAALESDSVDLALRYLDYMWQLAGAVNESDLEQAPSLRYRNYQSMRTSIMERLR